LGHNGAGKSTLIKLLADELTVQAGKVERSSELRIGYFAQHQLEQLHPEDTPLEHFFRESKRLNINATEQSLRSHLGGFGFSGDKVESKIAPFSGGEKARLVFATLVYQKPNLLLLDEPTNHLDLDMRHAISLALQEFEGAMVIVSHDRHLLRSVTDEFYLVADQKVAAFKGDLDDYRNWINDQKKLEAQTATTIKESSKSSSNFSQTPLLSKKDQKRLDAEKRKLLQPLKNKLSKLEKNMDKFGQAKEKLEAQLAGSEIYEDANKEQLKKLLQKQAQITQVLDETEEQWMQLSEELEDA